MRRSWQRAVNLRREEVGAKKRKVSGISMMYVDCEEKCENNHFLIVEWSTHHNTKFLKPVRLKGSKPSQWRREALRHKDFDRLSDLAQSSNG